MMRPNGAPSTSARCWCRAVTDAVAFLREMARKLRDRAKSESDFAAIAALETAADALERREYTGLEVRGG